MFLSGLVLGTVLTILGVLPLVTADSRIEDVHPLLLLPLHYYVIAVPVLWGISILLRKAADRVVSATN